MKDRAVAIFPYVLAAVLPLAGLLLAIGRAVEKRTTEAAWLLLAAALGTVIYAVLLAG